MTTPSGGGAILARWCEPQGALCFRIFTVSWMVFCITQYPPSNASPLTGWWRPYSQGTLFGNFVD